MTVEKKITAPQRKALWRIAQTGEAPAGRSWKTFVFLQRAGLIEPAEIGRLFRVPFRLTDSGRRLLSEGK